MKRIVTDAEVLSAPTVNAQTAAAYLGMDVNTLRYGMEHDAILRQIGTVTPTPHGRRSFHIIPERLVKYKHGEDLTPAALASVKMDQITDLLEEVRDLLEEVC